MPKTLLPKMFVRELNREIDKASNALNRVMELTETHGERLDKPDANARMLHACDDLESVHDEAEQIDESISHLLDLVENLRRYTLTTTASKR